jgi:hypothetical protein
MTTRPNEVPHRVARINRMEFHNGMGGIACHFHFYNIVSHLWHFYHQIEIW